jgi:hypothetical protein
LALPRAQGIGGGVETPVKLRKRILHITNEIMKMVRADYITMSRAAEILGITVSEARRIYNKGGG